VGAGLTGAAVAWAASSRGLDVIVVEAFGPGHRKGSSHGSARIFRRAYPDPLYVRLTGEAGRLWRRLEGEAGQPLLSLTGGVDFGPSDVPEHMASLLAACGVDALLLGGEEAAERWPGIDFGGGPVLFHPEAGVLDPEPAMTAMLRLATGRGAQVMFDTPAERLMASADGSSARVHTPSGTLTAPVVVVAVGAWAGPLLDGLLEMPPLTVTQQQVFHFAPAQSPARPWPVVIHHDPHLNFYGLPGGRDGGAPGAFKLGEHSNGTATTAAGRDFTVDPAARQRATSFVAKRLPGLEPVPLNEATCLYTRTPGEDFILDRPGGGPFVVASPCSGHGAKFAPLTGEIIAGLAVGEPSADYRFSLAAHLAR
jgi:sarcosine oxidase